MMKRSLAILFLVLVVLALTAPAGAAPPGDSVVGSNKVTSPNGFQHATMSAHSGPAGENPRGNVEVKFESPFLFGGQEAHVKGRVTCLDVSSNNAQIAALLKEPFQGNTHVTLIVNDGGNPTAGQSPDTVFIGFTSSPPSTCANFGTTLLGDTSGNVVVRDA